MCEKACMECSCENDKIWEWLVFGILMSKWNGWCWVIECNFNKTRKVFWFVGKTALFWPNFLGCFAISRQRSWESLSESKDLVHSKSSTFAKVVQRSRSKLPNLQFIQCLEAFICPQNSR